MNEMLKGKLGGVSSSQREMSGARGVKIQAATTCLILFPKSE